MFNSSYTFKEIKQIFQKSRTEWTSPEITGLFLIEQIQFLTVQQIKTVKECRDEERLNTRRLYWFTQMSYIKSHLIQGEIH